MSDILTPISPGELLDKLTILQIKLDKSPPISRLVFRLGQLLEKHRLISTLS